MITDTKTFFCEEVSIRTFTIIHISRCNKMCNRCIIIIQSYLDVTRYLIQSYLLHVTIFHVLHTIHVTNWNNSDMYIPRPWQTDVETNREIDIA